MRASRMTFTAVASAAALTLAACSATEPNPSSSAQPGTTPPASAAPVTVVTHDSFYVPEELVADFTAETGITVEFVSSGDGGSLVNQLILTADAPLADAVYGIDNTFASRLVGRQVIAPYTSPTWAALDPAVQGLEADVPGLIPVDFSDVCLNVDLTYFAAHNVAAPASFDDLLKPEYAGLVSVTNPATSSPGLAFLLATISAYGDDWHQYWEGLSANGLRVTGSWSDTYFVDFSAPNYGGDRPVVLSYASSPPSEVVDGTATTAALLDTCFRQVEYAGVLEGAANPEGAAAVIDWMLSDAFQSALPEAMYVYPVSASATIPAEWQEHAPLAANPWALESSRITAERDDWVLAWTSTVLG